MKPAGPQKVQQMPSEGFVAPGFVIEDFDNAIQAHGVTLAHYRAMRNPVGMVDRFDSRRPDPDHSGSSNGMLYTKAGCLMALFQGNTKDLRAQEGGLLDAATAQLTPHRFYLDGVEQVYLHPMDRLYLEDEAILVTHQQLVETHVTGTDKLRFQAVKVQDLVDASGTRYEPGIDFSLVNGKVVWGSNRPGIIPGTGKGVVYAVRFLYRPYWHVERLMHEVRVVTSENEFTGARTMVRMPQTAVVQREYCFESEAKDDEAKNPESPRQAPGPADGSFGVR